jgi:hypothetical protein
MNTPMKKSSAPLKKRPPAPNMPDALGSSGPVLIEEFFDDKQISVLNEKLKINLTTIHKEALNRTLVLYIAYTSSPKHARSVVYNVLESLHSGLESIIPFFSPSMKPDVKKSVQERILIEISEMQSHGQPAYAEHDFFYDDEKADAFLSRAILYKNALKNAIITLDKEGQALGSGRPANNAQDMIFSALKSIHEEAFPHRNTRGKKKAYERFCTEILKALPPQVRPKLEKQGSISKKRSRARA